MPSIKLLLFNIILPTIDIFHLMRDNPGFLKRLGLFSFYRPYFQTCFTMALFLYASEERVLWKHFNLEVLCHVWHQPVKFQNLIYARVVQWGQVRCQCCLRLNLWTHRGARIHTSSSWRLEDDIQSLSQIPGPSFSLSLDLSHLESLPKVKESKPP